MTAADQKSAGLTAIRSAHRVCFFAHYNPNAIVADHVIAYLAALKAAGFSTVFISTSALADADLRRLRDVTADVMLRNNDGLDFGGWIDACQRYFPLAAEFLLFANDSVYAPIGDFTPFFDRLTAVPADFYGAVESAERGRHLQSWFLLFRPAAYRSDSFRSLMLDPMPPSLAKAALIARYEVGLSQRLADAGFRHHAAFSAIRPGSLAEARPYNPMHLLWREVLAAGVPFLKVELVRSNPLRAAGRDEWQLFVARLAPNLCPLITADLRSRGQSDPPTRLALTQTPAINWSEVRPLVRADFHRPLRWPVYLLLYRAIVAATRVPRRLLQLRSR